MKSLPEFKNYFSENRASSLIYTGDDRPAYLRSKIQSFSPLREWPADEVKNVIDVMIEIFQYNPNQRASAEKLLKMPFFNNVDHNCLRE